MKFREVTTKKVNKEMLPQVVSRIFSICKTDTNFPLKDQINNIDSEISILKEKIKKQNDLFKQSQQLTHELNQRINMLEGRNQEIKEKLLETLGSEI
jgi:septal ring factor EnvC (AmiA/AmiB activator)